MYRIYTYSIVLMLMLQACSPKPVFRMTPEAGNTTYTQGTEYVYLEKGDIELTISYYHHLGKRFVMDVEIANETDSVLRVDPTDFSYEAYENMSANFPRDSDEILAARKAINPERELLRKDMEYARKVADQKTSTLLFAIGQTASIAHSFAEDDPEKREALSEQRQENYISYEISQRQREQQKRGLRDRRKVWEVDAIRTTDLYPGEYIRGFIFFKNEPDARGYMIKYDAGQPVFEILYRQTKYKVN